MRQVVTIRSTMMARSAVVICYHHNSCNIDIETNGDDRNENVLQQSTGYFCWLITLQMAQEISIRKYRWQPTIYAR
eukprot:scaffold27787_cov18-Prasinocladus_malaysianus.AAC.1